MLTDTLHLTLDGNPTRVVRTKNEGYWRSCSEGSWEPETYGIFRRFIDPCGSYLDIGAWIGSTVLVGCHLAKRAFAVEPNPVAFPELSANVELNRPATDNVRLFNFCIAPETGTAQLGTRSAPGASMSSLVFGDAECHWTVKTIRFAEFIESNDITDCRFIKIDIEAGEYSVVPTMVATLRQQRPTIYLSLHPGFLGDAGEGHTNLRSAITRLRSTEQLLRSLSFYRRFYDPFSRGTTLRHASTPRKFLHYILSRCTWKPSICLSACVYAVFGRPSSLVITEEDW
ncbi:MAG: FkbM family methyltransferase [Acidobacteriia bacterium]|nr:FkbM family methyltransferase [Terriglobia bacterium]